MYDIHPGDPAYITLPARHRNDITRSRVTTNQDQHFSIDNHLDIINFCRSTGLRKNKELATLRGGDIISYRELYAIKNADNPKAKRAAAEALAFVDVDYFACIRCGKGGKMRYAPIIGDGATDAVQKFLTTPTGKIVWPEIPKNMDVHALRADYCANIYRHYARPITDIPYDRINAGTGARYQSDVYTCRGDMRGKKFDKKAMKMCSMALGHNRISVVADHYLYQI